MSRPCIQVEHFVGDLDDVGEVNIIGPYPDEADRDKELARLNALSDGMFRAWATSADPQHPAAKGMIDNQTDADSVRDKTDYEAVLGKLLGWVDL